MPRLPIVDPRAAERIRAFEERRLPGYVGVVAVGDDGTVLHLSPPLAASLRWGEGELVGRSCFELIHEDDLEQAAESFAGTTERGGFHQPLTLRVHCGDGSVREVVVVAESLLEDPDLNAVVLSLADSADFGRIETLAIQNTTILERIAADAPIGETLESIATWLEQQIPGGRCVILLAQEADSFAIGAAPALEPAECAVLDGISVHEAGFLSATAWAGSEALVVTELPDPALPTTSTVAEVLDAEACWSVPIAHARGEAAWGAIEVHHRDPVHPRPEEWSSLLLGARLVALALESDQRRSALEHRATYDQMTGLANRHSIEARIAGLAGRDGGAVIFLDIDRLKLVNDTLGHAVGDEVIRSVAQRLAAIGSDQVMVGRFGGDEFVLVVEPSASSGVARLAERVLHQLRVPSTIGDRRLSATASIGIARASAGSSAETLLRDADLAMYDAKRAGGNCIRVGTESLRIQAARHLELEAELRAAISSDRIQVHFQPVVDMATGRVVSIEALARWRWGSRWISPAEFIPVAEESGLIIPLGEQVLHLACSALSALEGIAPELKVAVNVSPIQLQAGDTAQLVAGALEEWSLGPGRLCVEMTESVLMSNERSIVQEIRNLRSLGVSVAIDDFGTGYSSLAYLRRLPVDVLKIDRAFVQDCSDPTGMAMLDIIGTIARELGLRTVAEGVETAEQWNAVRSVGFDAVQGYLISRPVPLVELAGVVARLGAGEPAPPARSLRS